MPLPTVLTATVSTTIAALFTTALQIDRDTVMVKTAKVTAYIETTSKRWKRTVSATSTVELVPDTPLYTARTPSDISKHAGDS